MSITQLSKVIPRMSIFGIVGMFSWVFVRMSLDLVFGSTFRCFFSWEYCFDDLSRLKPKFRQKQRNIFLLKNGFSGRALKSPLRKLVRKNFLKFFHRFRFFHLDTFWYDDRYWKPSSGSTLHDSNDGLDISHDLNKFLYKMWAI